MLNLNRIWAIVLRYLIQMRHHYDRLSDMFFWPAMDFFLYGLTGFYLTQSTGKSQSYLFVVLSGLVFWVVIWRAQYEITTNLMAELWDRNIVSLFTTPLRLREWISAFMLMGFLKTFVSVGFSALLSFILYQYNVFILGGYIVIFIFNLLLTGWAIGFIVGGFIIYYGEKIQTLAWVGVMLIAPFSALYYPVSILPHWAQTVAYFIPSPYIFEAIREALFTGVVSYDKLLISFILNAVYFAFSIWFFVWMFQKSRKLGLGRLI